MAIQGYKTIFLETDALAMARANKIVSIKLIL
jgi:hypothetical protein